MSIRRVTLTFNAARHQANYLARLAMQNHMLACDIGDDGPPEPSPYHPFRTVTQAECREATKACWRLAFERVRDAGVRVEPVHPELARQAVR